MKKMFMMEMKNSVKAPLLCTNPEDRRNDDGNGYLGNDESDSNASNNGNMKMIRLKQKMMWGSGHGCDLYGSFNVATNQGWGIPVGLGLRGGGLNSLNNGGPNNGAAAAGWGAPPPPGGNSSSSGWGQPPSAASSVVGSGQASVTTSSPGGLVNTPANNQQVNPSPANNNHPSGSNQWASTSPNRNTSQNTNGQPTIISGSQMNNNPSSNATSAPPGGNSMQMGNQNVMGNTPNSPMNPGSVGTNPNQNSGPGGTNTSGGLITNSASSWAQAAAGKSLQPANSNNNNNTMNNVNNPSNTSAMSNNPNAMNSNSVNNPGVAGHGPMSGITNAPPGSSSSVTSKQIEQLNSMREALFSHDGWGGQNVNQDSGWDIPSSPELDPASAASASNWKVNVNNGTDLWEANLRGGGVNAAPAAPKPAWGPSTNIGGTWGEEDDGADSSNVWTGVPPASSNVPGPNNSAPPSNNSSAGNSNNSGQMQWSGMNNSGIPNQQQPPPLPVQQQQSYGWGW